MHKLTFYPLGNADCCKLDLSDGRKLLFDYANCRDTEDEDDLRIDLAVVLREDLKAAERTYFDVVAFTHCDDDHIRGFSDFFYLEHAKKYQTGDRISIVELWVPAAIIVEEGLTSEARIVQAEARYRLKKSKGIRVFSRPTRLKEWLEKEGITTEGTEHLITDAGQLVPGFDKVKNEVEFFVHSPFAAHVGDALVDRNEAALILHATFSCNRRETRFMIIGDTTYEVLSDIVNITKFHKRDERLKWDVFNIPHHCSYLALSSDRGKNKTEAVPAVKWLLEQGSKKGLLVSCSNIIPDTNEEVQPPHREAANCYREVADSIDGEFKVTMEHPSVRNPQPLEITIDNWGATLKKTLIGGGPAVISRVAPRAGIICDR